MKKILLAALILTVGMSANAQDALKSGTVSLDYVLPSSQNNFPIIGTQVREGDYDYITISGIGSTVSYASDAPHPQPVASSDPYMIKIGKTQYLMILDNKDGKWNENDILGFSDKKEELFKSLINLNSDNDKTKLTSSELKARKIRFVQISSKGALLVKDKSKDFELSKIDYIDLKNLKTIANSSTSGVNGHFNLYLKTTNPSEKLVTGYVIYFSDDDLKTLFTK